MEEKFSIRQSHLSKERAELDCCAEETDKKNIFVFGTLAICVLRSERGHKVIHMRHYEIVIPLTGTAFFLSLGKTVFAYVHVQCAVCVFTVYAML